MLFGVSPLYAFDKIKQRKHFLMCEIKKVKWVWNYMRMISFWDELFL